MKRGRYFAAAAIAVAAVVIAAALSACQTFRPDVAVAPAAFIPICFLSHKYVKLLSQALRNGKI